MGPVSRVSRVARVSDSPARGADLLSRDSTQGRLALLAVQASDGPRAVAAARGLRALQARHAAGEGRGPQKRSHGVI